jgi:hypothetical protein
MKNPIVTLANDSHRDAPVVSLNFEKDHGFIFRPSQQKTNKTAQSGWVSVPFTKRNEEIAVTSLLYKCWGNAKEAMPIGKL